MPSRPPGQSPRPRCECEHGQSCIYASALILASSNPSSCLCSTAPPRAQQTRCLRPQRTPPPPGTRDSTSGRKAPSSTRRPRTATLEPHDRIQRPSPVVLPPEPRATAPPHLLRRTRTHSDQRDIACCVPGSTRTSTRRDGLGRTSGGSFSSRTPCSRMRLPRRTQNTEHRTRMHTHSRHKDERRKYGTSERAGETGPHLAHGPLLAHRPLCLR